MVKSITFYLTSYIEEVKVVIIKVLEAHKLQKEDNLNQVVYGANRFFSEGTTDGILGIFTGKGAFRK